jgi:hypothetical protein
VRVVIIAAAVVWLQCNGRLLRTVLLSGMLSLLSVLKVAAECFLLYL